MESANSTGQPLVPLNTTASSLFTFTNVLSIILAICLLAGLLIAFIKLVSYLMKSKTDH